MSSPLVDISHPIECTIREWRDVGDHVEYRIDIVEQLGSNQTWEIWRRYSDFSKLNNCLLKFNIDLKLPPKKFLGNRKEAFIIDRLKMLQKFLDYLTSHLLLTSYMDTVKFFDIADGKPADHLEWFLCSARDNRKRVLSEQIHCGWRYAKITYRIANDKVEYMLSGIRYGPDKRGSVEQLNKALSFFRTLQFPYLNHCTECWANGDGILFVHPVFRNGTIRDYFHESKWNEKFFKKYYKNPPMQSLELPEICFIGRQVLETLLFFCTLGIPYLNVHCGNIVITSAGCELIDLEQVLAGQPCFFRNSMLRISAIKTIEDMMVYAFGELLFEMLTRMFALSLDEIYGEIDSLPFIFRSVISSIMMPEKASLPTLTELLSIDLFANVNVARTDTTEISMPTNVKQFLDELCNQICRRLQIDRIQFNRNRKECKLKEMLNSEGEKLRRKQIVRSEQQQLKQRKI